LDEIVVRIDPRVRRQISQLPTGTLSPSTLPFRQERSRVQSHQRPRALHRHERSVPLLDIPRTRIQ
jgi:hypothetical protein